MTNKPKGGDTNALSTDINTITAEINAYQRVAGEAIFEIGRRLKHVKENDLAHGEFGKWLEKAGIHERQAQRLIKVANEFGSNTTSWSELPFRNLYEIATLPPEQREQTHITEKGDEKKPSEMTVRELREVKRQLRQAEQSAEIERKERERLEVENETLAEREPEVRYETKTEYIEVRDEDIERRLASYEEKFGDLRNYDEHVMATHVQDMISSTISFKRGVREFVKRFSYMTKYKDAINRMDHISKTEYNEAVKAIHEMADSFEYLDEGDERIIIEQ